MARAVLACILSLGTVACSSGGHTNSEARAFEPFFTTKEQGAGTGLGLSTVHGIVTKSRGYVLFESRTGAGTRFDVYLPHVDVPISSSKPVPQPHAAGGTETILVVEDEPQIRELLAAELRDLGYSVIEAGDAAEAVDSARSAGGPIDLVLTDIVMPGRRGTSLVKLLQETNPGIAVVYMSGYIDDAVLSEVEKSGEPFISKPYEVERISRVFRDELDGRAQRPSAGTRSA